VKADQRTVRLRRAILYWWKAEARAYPWRELGRTPYEILVAEVLLKRTTATAASRVYAQFLQEFPSIRAIDAAEISELEQALVSIGLYRQRAKGLKQMARYLMLSEGGEVPTTLSQLRKVPHIGSYTAAAITSFALDIPVAVLDSNVERILRRVYRRSIEAQPCQSSLSQRAQSLLPTKHHREFNLALLDFGALVCRYVRPNCPTCPIAELCDSAAKIPTTNSLA
jgi:A/G-specific adenine glycosylase